MLDKNSSKATAIEAGRSRLAIDFLLHDEIMKGIQKALKERGIDSVRSIETPSRPPLLIRANGSEFAEKLQRAVNAFCRYSISEFDFFGMTDSIFRFSFLSMGAYVIARQKTGNPLYQPATPKKLLEELQALREMPQLLSQLGLVEQELNVIGKTWRAFFHDYLNDENVQLYLDHLRQHYTKQIVAENDRGR